MKKVIVTALAALSLISTADVLGGWTWDDAGSTIIAQQQGPHEGNGV